MKIYDLVIIGGGAAGLSCALESYKLKIGSILIIEKEHFLGGILNQCIHNGFGLHTFKEELSGPSYAQRYIDELAQTEVELMLDTMVLNISDDLQIEVASQKLGYQIIKARSIMLACGSYERGAGAIGLSGKRIQGIMSAGLAQHYMNIDGYYIGKKVFILGSGDIGLIMARRLTLEGVEVVGVAEIMPYSNGLARNVRQCLEDFNIPLYLSHTISDVKGDKRVQAITICQVDESFKPIANTQKTFEVDCLLLSVGLIPDTSLLDNTSINISPITKGPCVDNFYQTNIPGIFAAGNNVHIHDLVDFVSIEGHKAAQGIAAYLNHQKALSTIKVNHRGLMSYVVPQTINLVKDTKVTALYRIKKPIEKYVVNVYDHDVLVTSKKGSHLLPSLMNEIELDLNTFNQDSNITIEVLEVN